MLRKSSSCIPKQMEAKVDSELKACHETRPGALVEDKYSMMLKH